MKLLTLVLLAMAFSAVAHALILPGELAKNAVSEGTKPAPTSSPSK